MKTFILLVMICSLTLALSCSTSDPVAPANQYTNQLSNFETGRIIVHVHWNNVGIAGTSVEVLGLGKVKVTDSDGIAVFRAPAGTFVVRIYGVNQGGPAFKYIDHKVTVTPEQDVHVDQQVCLPCV